jgi:hypothetical protein
MLFYRTNSPLKQQAGLEACFTVPMNGRASDRVATTGRSCAPAVGLAWPQLRAPGSHSVRPYGEALLRPTSLSHAERQSPILEGAGPDPIRAYRQGGFRDCQPRGIVPSIPDRTHK